MPLSGPAVRGGQRPGQRAGRSSFHQWEEKQMSADKSMSAGMSGVQVERRLALSPRRFLES